MREPYSDLPALDSVSALAVPALWVLPYSESIHSWRLFRDLFQDWLTDFFLDIFSRESAENQKNIYLSCAVTGFLSAFLNTLFFMGLLVGLFGNTEYVQGLMGGKNVILFICTFVGINAVCEMLSATVITGAVGAALYKARLLPETEKKSEKVVKTAEA